MSLLFFLITGVFLLALSSFSLVPFLSTGVLFFAWLGYGFFRFSLKPIEVFTVFVVLAVFFSLFSGLNIFSVFLLLGLPPAILLPVFKRFANLNLPLKTFLGGSIYLVLTFLGTNFLGLARFILVIYSILTLFVLVMLEFFATRTLKKIG